MVEELYTLHREALLRYCILLCGDVALAEDIVQNAFMRAISHFDDLEKLNPAQRRSWLYKTIRNLFYDHVRRVSVGREKEKPADEATEETGYEETEIYMLLACLPYELSVLFSQRYIEGYTSTELGDIYGVPPATIRGKLMKARTILKEFLKEDKI